MAELTKEELRKAGTVTITDSSGNVSKVTAPNSLEVGLDDPEFKKSLTVHGAATVHQGITGSITKLPDGSDYLQAGTNIVITQNPNGSMTLTAADGSAARNTQYAIAFSRGLSISTGDPSNLQWDGSAFKTVSVKIDNDTITADGGADADELRVTKLPYSLSPSTTGGLTGGNFNGNSDVTTWAVLKKTDGGLNSDTDGLFIDINSETSGSSATTDEILVYKAGFGLRKISLQQVANLANTGFAGSTTNTLTDGNGISDFTFDGSTPGVQVSVESADATISSTADGVKVVKVPNNLTNSSGISEFTYDGSTGGISIGLDVASNSGLDFKAQQLAVRFSNIPTAAIDDSDFLPFYDISGGPSGLGKVLYSDLKAGINAGLSFNTPWVDLGNNLQTTSSVALAGDYGASYSVTNVGTDVYFFVSGSKFGKGISARTVSAFAGDVVVTGSLYVDSSQVLIDGSGYVNFGSTIGNSGYGIRSNAGELQYKNSSGAWVNFGTTASPKADPDAQYLVLSATSSLNSERVMTVSTGLNSVDSGAGAAYTLTIDDSVVSTLTGSEFSGIVKLNSVTSASDILPIADSTYVIGNENLRWKSISTNQISYEVNAGNTNNYNTINLNADSMPSGRNNSIYIQSVQSVLMALDSNDGNTGNYFAIFNNVGTSSIGSTDLTDAVFKVSESGRIHAKSYITSSLGFSGSLTHLADGTPFIRGGDNVTVFSGSNGWITISAPTGDADSAAQYLVLSATSSLDNERVFTASTGLLSSDGGAGEAFSVSVDDSVVATLTGSTFSGTIKAPSISGSITHLSDGTSYLIAGENVSIISSSGGSVTINSYAAGGGSPGGGNSDKAAQYLVLAATASLTAERVFNPSTGISVSDGGAGGNYTLAIDDSTVATLTGSIFSGDVVAESGLSGSLQMLSDGSTRYLIGTGAVQITTQSSGQVVVSASEGKIYTAGTGINLNGAVFSVDDSVVATLTGSVFSGNVVAQTGLSGSIQMLSDGSTRYIVGTGSVLITTQSSGQIVVSSSEGKIYTAGTGINLTGTTFSVDNSVVATLTGSQFTGNVAVTGSLVSTDKVTSPAFSGSLTHLSDGTSYLIGGSNITITTGSSGAVTVAASGGEISVASGSTSVSSVTTIDFTNAGIVQNVGDGTVAITGSIGPAEDGTYSDGLFATFTPVTPIGTAVDRFNEVLKALSPAPAPDLDNINSAETGVYSKLSFGASSAVSGYTNVAASAGYGSAVDVNGAYQVVTASNNIRMATFDGSTHVTGTLNSDVSPSNYSNGNTNYTTSSFGDADQGVLRLMVNGSNVKEIDLTESSIGAGSPGTGTATHANANGSGFIELSQTGSAVFEDGKTLSFFQHRTGKYVVSTSDQRDGWNYVRVLHVLSGSTKETNYMEWVNDSDSNALAANNEIIEGYDLGKGIYLSGIQYYISGTANYKVDVSNVYRNVYSGSVSFNATNCSISDQAIPALDTGAGESNISVLKVTGSATITATTLLNQTIGASVNVTHPLKSDLSSGGSATSTGILLYSASNDSTALVETFKRENYRITSASYDTQASVVAAGATWDSTLHLSGAADQTDGLIFYNEKLYTPTNSLLSGDFRNSSDGGSIANAPSGNPNYSGLSSGTKTFYRHFQNTAGQDYHDISVDIDGSGTIVQQGNANNTTRLSVMFKLPDTGNYQTGWLDLSQTFKTGSYSDGDGCLFGSFDSSLDAVNIATFGTQSIGDNRYLVMKVEADASWTGNIDDITVSFGAGTGTAPTEAPALDDVDCDDSGTGVKLSFGSSQSVSGYTNVGTTAGFSAVDVNGSYTETNSGNNLRQAAFDGSTVIDGTLNEDVSSGTGYPANSFSSGSFGSLKLEVNGSVLRTVDLTTFGAGNSLNGNSSGFINLSSPTPGEYSGNSVPNYTLVYRTGSFQVGTSDQRDGWNYVRVVHTVDGSDTTTNYVEWVNDPNADALATSGESYDNYGSNSTLFYQSGVKYFISCTSSFAYAASNVYKNVYSRDSSAVTSPTRNNLSVTQIAVNGTGVSNSTNSDYRSSLPDLDTGVTDCEQKSIDVTGSISFSQSTSLPGHYGTGYHTASISGRVKHPIKSNVTTSTFNKANFLVFSASQTSDKYTTENFDDENFRLISSSLSNQSSISTSGWNPAISVNDASKSSYYDGLILYNGYLITPSAGSIHGDFRSVKNGGSLQSPDENVNYSSLGSNERNYTRYFENNTTSDVPQINVMLTGSANLVARDGANSGSLGSNNNFYCSVKIPGKTGWLDLARASAGAGSISNGDGGLSGDLTATVDSDGALNICTFNGETQDGTTSGQESVAIRITTHKDWTGYITGLKVGY